MKKALSLSFCAALVATLSSCELSTYNTALCGPGNVQDASSLSGDYLSTTTVTEDGQTQNFGTNTPAKIVGDAKGSVTMTFSGMPVGGDSQTLTLCGVNGKILLEYKGDSGARVAYETYILSPTHAGFEMQMAAYDAAAVRAKMPVETTSQPANHDFPIAMTANYADNSKVSAADFANFLNPSLAIDIKLVKKP